MAQDLKVVVERLNSDSASLTTLLEGIDNVDSTHRLQEETLRFQNLLESWFAGPVVTQRALSQSVYRIPNVLRPVCIIKEGKEGAPGLSVLIERLLVRSRVPAASRLINEKTCENFEKQATAFESLCETGGVIDQIVDRISARRVELQHKEEEQKLLERIREMSCRLEKEEQESRTAVAGEEPHLREALHSDFLAKRKKLKKKQISAAKKGTTPQPTPKPSGKPARKGVPPEAPEVLTFQQTPQEIVEELIMDENDDREEIECDEGAARSNLAQVFQDEAVSLIGKAEARELHLLQFRVANVLVAPLPIVIAHSTPLSSSNADNGRWSLLRVKERIAFLEHSSRGNDRGVRWTLTLSLDTLDLLEIFYGQPILPESSLDDADSSEKVSVSLAHLPFDEELVQRAQRHTRERDVKSGGRGGRRAVSSDQPLLPGDVASSRMPKRLTDQAHIPLLAVILAHGGYFAAGVFDCCGNLVIHKTISRYVTRRGQGGRQSAHAGRTDTAGSQIRAHHEKKWIEESREVVAQWACFGAAELQALKPSPSQKGDDDEVHQRMLAKAAPNEHSLLGRCSRIYVHAPGTNNQGMLLHRNALDGQNLPHSKFVPLHTTDLFRPKVRRVAISTGRPSLDEVKRVFASLVACSITGRPIAEEH